MMRRAIWLAALVVACGDDEGDASANKKLGELNAEELSELCAEVDARFARFEIAYVSAMCTQMGRAVPATCEATRSQCIASTNPMGALGEMDRFECQGTPASVVSACPELSRAEHDACADDLVEFIETLSSKITCTADLDNLKPPERPATCTRLRDRCPLLSTFELTSPS
jgi:hypothetical protein